MDFNDIANCRLRKKRFKRLYLFIHIESEPQGTFSECVSQEQQLVLKLGIIFGLRGRYQL